jgi:PqqD family protein of HPr-rel-A system
LSFEKKSSDFFWRCECFPDLLHHLQEQERFVFNPLTGHTHILNQLSWQLLSACADIPRSNAHLFELMAAESEGLDNQQLDDSLQEHLGQLLQLDLLQRIG